MASTAEAENMAGQSGAIGTLSVDAGGWAFPKALEVPLPYADTIRLSVDDGQRSSDRPINHLLNLGDDVIALSVKTMKKGGRDYRLIQQGKKGLSITLGYVTPDAAVVALVGARVLAGFPCQGLPTLQHLVSAVQDARQRFPELPSRQATEKVRDEVVTVLTRVAQVALDYARENCPEPVDAEDAQGIVDDFTGRLLKELNGTPQPKVNYAAMALRNYFEDVFKPVRKTATPKSWRAEEGFWKNQILPVLGDRLLKELNAQDADKMISNMRKEDGSPASGSYKRLVKYAYKALLTYAERSGHIGEIHKFYRIEGSTQQVMQKDVLTLDEFGKILEHSSPFHRAVYTINATCGLRPSEGARLRWEDVDWTAKTIKIDGTKTDTSKGVVPLLTIAEENLGRWWDLCGRPETGWMFPARGARPRDWESGSWRYSEKDAPMVHDSDEHAASTYKRALATAKEAAGISKRVTPYTLRSMFATWCLQAGVKGDDVRRVMRHTSERMIKEFYDRSTAAEVVDVEKMNGVFTKKPEPAPQPNNAIPFRAKS